MIEGSRERGRAGTAGSGVPINLAPRRGLRERMEKLSVAYQDERPNVEAVDLTAVVIQALGLLIGKLTMEMGEPSEGCEPSERYKTRHFILTGTITDVVHTLLNAQELDINPDHVTSTRVGNALRKMRLISSRQSKTGKKGWLVSLDDAVRWTTAYGMDPSTTPGLNLVPHLTGFTGFTGFTTFTPAKGIPRHGVL